MCNFLIFRLNQLIAYVFIFEMIVKIIDFGPKEYISNFLNCFDCIVTNLAVVDLIFQYQGVKNNVLSSTRVLRVIRLLRELTFMKVIIQTF